MVSRTEANRIMRARQPLVGSNRADGAHDDVARGGKPPQCSISDAARADQPVNVVEPDHRVAQRDIPGVQVGERGLMSGMAAGQDPNSSAMTLAAIFVLPTMEEPISKTGRPARNRARMVSSSSRWM